MATERLLEVRDVSKRFGELVVFNGISFDVERGEFITIFGPSGCGKTTILKLLGGLENPTDGTILYDGAPIYEDLDTYKKQTAFVWQSDRLAPWKTAGGNVRLALSLQDASLPEEELKERVTEALSFVELEQFSDKLPRYLSGGMRQRVNLARALSLQSEIIFMDEPLSGLNELVEKKNLKQKIIELHDNTNKTLLYVTHSIDDAVTMSDRIIVLSQNPTKILDIYTNPNEKTIELKSESQLNLKNEIKQLVESALT